MPIENINVLCFSSQRPHRSQSMHAFFQILAPPCRFKSAFICVYQRFRIAGALILLKPPARNKIYKNVYKCSMLFTAKNAKLERFLRHIFAPACDFTSAQICGSFKKIPCSSIATWFPSAPRHTHPHAPPVRIVPAAPDIQRKMKLIFHTTLTTNSSASTGSIFANFLVASILESSFGNRIR
jgi:hypothetical protein